MDFLPDPVIGIVEKGDSTKPPKYDFIHPPKSIGRIKAFNGHFAMIVRAYVYIRMNGPDGLRKVAEFAVLNANYLLAKLRDRYHLPYDRICMHEFVVEGRWPDVPGITALDISKRLMDYGFHAPTETESKQSLDAFADAMIKIYEEAHSEPELLKNAPYNTPVRRVDEVKAAKELVICCDVSALLD